MTNKIVLKRVYIYTQMHHNNLAPSKKSSKLLHCVGIFLLWIITDYRFAIYVACFYLKMIFLLVIYLIIYNKIPFMCWKIDLLIQNSVVKWWP
jgi:hypothetical protein